MHARLDDPVTAQILVEMSFSPEPTRPGLVARPRRKETHMEMLAHEIVRYAPSLALKLARAGRKRMVHQLR